MSDMTITHDFQGEHGSGRYHLHLPNETRTIEGKDAGFLALLLSGRKVKPEVNARDVFDVKEWNR